MAARRVCSYSRYSALSKSNLKSSMPIALKNFFTVQQNSQFWKPNVSSLWFLIAVCTRVATSQGDQFCVRSRVSGCEDSGGAARAHRQRFAWAAFLHEHARGIAGRRQFHGRSGGLVAVAVRDELLLLFAHVCRNLLEERRRQVPFARVGDRHDNVGAGRRYFCLKQRSEHGASSARAGEDALQLREVRGHFEAFQARQACFHAVEDAEAARLLHEGRDKIWPPPLEEVGAHALVRLVDHRVVIAPGRLDARGQDHVGVRLAHDHLGVRRILLEVHAEALDRAAGTPRDEE
eukprot:5390922-Prymnesium_polylepis.1